MYPLRLNLLSSRKKDHLKRMTHFQAIKNLLEIFLIVASVVAIVLLGSQTVLQNYFSTLTENIVTINNEHTTEIREIMHINRLLDKTSKIQKNYVSWTTIMTSITSSTPDNVILNSLDLNYAEGKATITGHADTRKTFLELQERLESNPFLTKISSPLSGLTKKEDISFSIEATLAK